MTFLGPTAALALCLASTANADQVVQVPLTTFMTARAVTTLTGGKLVPWTMGIDGGGAADGYMTAAASRFHNDPPNLKSLPDNGTFAADARHPEVVLHFSNDADAASQQTYWVKGMGTFTFAVPSATYSKMFLFLTSSEGASLLKINLVYSDATEVSSVNLPDYYADVPATDPVLFNLASDLPKWTKTGAVAEQNHHNLTGVEIHPAAGKVLGSIRVEKGAAGYLVFWGATGVATSPVDPGTDAGFGGASLEAGTVVDAAGTGGGGSSGGNATGGGGGGVAAGSSGASGLAGQGGAAGASVGEPSSAEPSSDSGGSCRAARRGGEVAGAAWLSLALGTAWLRRRRTRRSPLSRDERSLRS
jgi:hypothetical protein